MSGGVGVKSLNEGDEEDTSSWWIPGPLPLGMSGRFDFLVDGLLSPQSAMMSSRDPDSCWGLYTKHEYEIVLEFRFGMTYKYETFVWGMDVESEFFLICDSGTTVAPIALYRVDMTSSEIECEIRGREEGQMQGAMHVDKVKLRCLFTFKTSRSQKA